MSGASPLFWDGDGPPRSRLYDDIYFSREDGLAEARDVFLAGCGLPEAWRRRRRFTVAELGFGTGLTLAALLELWGREGPADGRLHVFTVEAHPVDAADAARALAAWPELAGVSALLADRWPGRARGFHRIDLPELRASLDVAIMEAGAALERWTGAADAWFLDGFAPAKNPAMWRAEVLEAVAAHCAPGARAATYTAAGEVRRALADAGFSVERRPGFGRKIHRLEARMADGVRREPAAPRVAIVGGGIAGASLARAFRALGMEPSLFDSRGAEGAAAALPAALVSPRLDAGLGAVAALFAQAFARARTLYGAAPGAILGSGAIQLAQGPKDPGRFVRIAGSDLFEAGDATVLTAPETSARLGETAPASLALPGALTVHPAAVLRSWSGPPAQARIAAIAPGPGGWRLTDAMGALVAEADVVCLAAAMDSARLSPALPLAPVRGQASFAPEAASPGAALFGGYALAVRGGTLFGATHDRGDTGTELREADHRRNLEQLAGALPGLAGRIDVAGLAGWAGVRATTADFLPLAGRVPDSPDGLFALTGLGSRGFTLAPLLAEHVAALALGAPSPLPADLAALVEPGRFEVRRRRRLS